MSKLLRRLHRLETRVTDSHGLVPHSTEWFEFWDVKIDRVMTGEQVDLSGMTLEYIDAMIARGREPTDNDAGHYQATCDP
jgi:hypothetical protein